MQAGLHAGTEAPPSVEQQLQTADPAEQARRLAHLVTAASAAPAVLTVVVNPATYQAQVVASAGLSYDEQHALLAQAGQWLRQQERAEAQQAAGPAASARAVATLEGEGAAG